MNGSKILQMVITAIVIIIIAVILYYLEFALGWVIGIAIALVGAVLIYNYVITKNWREPFAFSRKSGVMRFSDDISDENDDMPTDNSSSSSEYAEYSHAKKSMMDE
jgi:hypothetical protein